MNGDSVMVNIAGCEFKAVIVKERNAFGITEIHLWDTVTSKYMKQWWTDQEMEDYLVKA